MIIRIFKYISKRLNSIIKFISVRILKRKTKMTVIEFIYLILNQFQKTIFYKALTIIYKVVAVFIAFLSLGIFYDENFKFSGTIDFINKIVNIIIGIYNILYKGLISILKLIFTNIFKTTEIVDEEYDIPIYLDYAGKTYNLGQEKPYHWYQDYYVIGGSILILLLLGYGYKKWDNDSTLKDNILEIGSSLFLIIKSIKDSLFNNRNNQDSNNESSNSDNDSENDLTNDDITIGVTPENVDVRIISDAYRYTLFKNLHDLNDWPEFNSDEHNSLINKLNNTESRKIYHTYENIENLIDKYFNSKEIIKNANPEELNELENSDAIIKLHKHFEKTNEEVSTILKTMKKDYMHENDEWIRTRSFELSNKNDSPESSIYNTPKASTSQLPDITPKASTSVLNLSTETSFESNIKGKFKTKDYLFEKMRENINEQADKIKNVISKTSVSNIINTTTELINEDSDLENITEIKNDNVSYKNNQNKNPLPDVNTYKLDISNPEDKIYHIHKSKPNELCDCVPKSLNEAQREIIKDYSKSYNMKSIFNSITGQGNKPQLNTISEDELNIWSKNNVDQEKLDMVTKGKVIGDTIYIDPKNLVHAPTTTIKNEDNPLVHKLSNQLDKMKINEITEDEIKRAPTWEDEK